MKEVFKDYWWIVFIIIGAPIAINFITLIPAFTPLAGCIKDWVAFWGGYLSAIISAMVAFIILIIQRKDNQRERMQDHFDNQIQQFKNRSENRRENSRNREDNRIENSKNRQLQINAIKYQQQLQWLDRLSKAMIDNIMIYNPNHLSNIINIMYQKQSFKLIHDQINDLLNQLILTDTAVGFLMPESQSDILRAYNHIRKECYTNYNQIIMEIQTIAIKHSSLIEKRDYLINQDTAPEDSKTFLKELDSINTEEDLLEKAESLRKSFEKTFERIRTNAINCLNGEKKRIDSIIEEEYGTK